MRACIAFAAATLAVGCGGQDGGAAAGTARAPLVVCAPGATVPGVDVAAFQGTVDWNAVRASGVVFAIARLGQGLVTDASFDANWAGVKAAGLVRGAYQGFDPALDAIAQADLAIGKIGLLGAGDLPIQLDVEITSGKTGPEILAGVTAWSGRVLAGTGKAPMIYTGATVWNAGVGGAPPGSSRLWVAHWGAACPNLPDGWSDWSIWQTASNGTVPGVPAACDLDVFNGSVADLARFVGLGVISRDAGVVDAGAGATDGHAPTDAPSGSSDAGRDARTSTVDGATDRRVPPISPSSDAALRDARPALRDVDSAVLEAGAEPRVGGAAGSDGGCGCRAARERGDGSIAAALAMFAVVTLRKRRGR